MDEDGNVLNRYEYDAFGNFTLKEETVENRFGFAGEQYDPAANLYYLRARFYNPVIGRFIQEDTYYGDGLNLYTYCHNNPVGYVDPSGHTGNCPNKQAAIDYLRNSHEDWTDAQIEAEYQRIRHASRDDAAVARAIITGDTTGVANSDILRANMKLDGQVTPSYPNAAHHIVAASAPEAQFARDILAEYGINYNDACNGVFLPYARNEYVTSETMHVGSHKGEYYRYVNKYLQDGIKGIEEAGRTVTDVDIKRMLGEIRQGLLSGRVNLN